MQFISRIPWKIHDIRMEDERLKQIAKIIKVLFIVHESSLGGATWSLVDYINVKDKRILPFIILPEGGQVENIVRKIGVKYFIIPFKNGFGKIDNYTDEDVSSNFINNYRAAIKITEIVKQERIDIIHSNSSVIDVGAMVSAIANIPHVWHIREFMEEDFNWEYWDKNLKNRLFCCTNELISVSDSVRDAFEAKYGFKSHRIYDGIAAVNSENGELKIAKSNEFLFAGRISENKGQMDAVLAVKVLVEKGIDVKLYIIGNGNGQIKWVIDRFIKDNRLENNIEVIPYCEDLSIWRKRCSFSITGSKMEALGRVTVEAMACGIIPIGTDTGGTGELIGKDGDRGFLYEYGNYEQLANKMIDAMYLSLDDRCAILSRMQRYVEDSFRLDEYAQRLYELYTRVELEDEKSAKREVLRKYLEERYSSLDMDYISKDSDERDYSTLRKRIQQDLAYIVKYCKDNSIETAIIYGMGYVGCALYDVFEANNIKVVGVMDRSQKYLGLVTTVINPGDDVQDADCIFITIIKDDHKIVEYMRQIYSIRIISVLALFEDNQR